MNTSKTSLVRALTTQLNDLNRQMGWSQITTANDPRIALHSRINATMDTMSDDEQETLLNEWGR